MSRIVVAGTQRPCAACGHDAATQRGSDAPGTHPADAELCPRCAAVASLMRCQRHAADRLDDGRARGEAVAAWLLS